MDTIGDLITRIRNAAMAGKERTEAPWSRIGEAVSGILVKKGYLKSAEIKKDGIKQLLVLEIAFGDDKKPTVSHIKRVSKPGRRIYVTAAKLPKVLRGYGLAVISTPKGVMTDAEARKAGAGGEVLCEAW